MFLSAKPNDACLQDKGKNRPVLVKAILTTVRGLVDKANNTREKKNAAIRTNIDMQSRADLTEKQKKSKTRAEVPLIRAKGSASFAMRFKQQHSMRSRTTRIGKKELPYTAPALEKNRDDVRMKKVLAQTVWDLARVLKIRFARTRLCVMSKRSLKLDSQVFFCCMYLQTEG